MSIQNKITSALVSSLLLLALVANTSFAAVTVTISGNGALSDNFVTIDHDNDISVTQTNDANVVNNIASNINTGRNRSSFNTGGDAVIVAGNARSNVSVSNNLNSNFLHIGGGQDNGNSSGGNGNSDEKTRFFTTLNGGEEVPGPGDPDGFGLARITLNHTTDQICSNLIVGNVQTPTAAHIHKAPIGVAGPVVVTLPNPADGSENGCVDVNESLLTEIHNNPSMFYVNVHNSQYPDGAVRGQL